MGRPKHVCSNCSNYQVLNREECCIVTLSYTKPTDACNCDSFKSHIQSEREDEEAYREHMERD